MTPSHRRTRAPRRGVRAILALVSALALCPWIEAAPAPADPGGESEVRRLQEEIGAGFREGDADRIAALLSPKVKTYVACRLVADADGYYGADQLRLLLRRLFRGRETARFEVVQPAAPRAGEQAVLQALWSYREGGATATLRLAFTLARDTGTWRLREIRERS